MNNSTATHPAITLNGSLGSGKSRVARQLTSEMDFEYVYTGAIQRQIADRLGMTTRELSEYSETHPEIDEEIDSVFKSLRHAEYPVMVDSRMAWHFLPHAFKVHVTVSLAEGARRIMHDADRVSERYENLRHAMQEMHARKESDTRRYADLYGVHYDDLNNYHLVVDSTHSSPEKVADKIKASFAQWQQSSEPQLVHEHFVAAELIKVPTDAKPVTKNWLAQCEHRVPVRALEGGEFEALVASLPDRSAHSPGELIEIQVFDPAEVETR